MKLRILSTFLIPFSPLFAAPDTVDTTFATSAGQVFDSAQFGGVASSIVQPDGKVIFGTNEMPGSIGGTPYQLPLTRFNPDGSIDSTYGADNHPTGGGTGIVFFADGWPEVHAMALQADGKLIAAGDMQGYSDDGTSITHGGQSIVRLNADGTPDPTFATRGTTPASGFNFINDVEVQSDGKILASGGFGGVQNSDFTFFNRKGIVRFNSDGTVDPSFSITPSDYGVSNFVNGFVRDAEITPGGEIYAAISFSQGATELFHGLCRLRPDGSRDLSFAPSYSGDFIQAINLDSAGRILVVGRDKDATVPHVERFFPSGAKDPSFTLDPSLGLVAAEQLEDSPSGQYYLATNEGSTAIRINSDGSLDPSFNATSDHPDAPAGPSTGFFRCFTLSPDGSVYAGSFFSSVDTISTKKIVKFEGEPTPGTSLINFASTDVTAIESDRILTFSAVRTGDLIASATATVLVTGGTADASDFTSATPYTLTWPAGTGGAQHFSITLQDDDAEDGDKTVTFSISSAGGANVGSRDAMTLTIIDDEAPATITSPPADLTAISGADATFSISITSATPATFQWKLNGTDIIGATGSSMTLPAVSGDLDGASISVVITNGHSSITSPVATLTVATPDGSRDFSFPGDPGSLSTVSQLIPLSDGSIILVPFASAFSGPVRLSRLLPDGSLDPDFGPDFENLSGTSQITDVQVTPSGKIIVSGLFNSVDGVARDGLARLTADGNIDTFFTPPGRPISLPFVDSSGRVYLSLGFSSGLIRLLDDGSIDPGFDANVARDSRGGGTIYGMAEDQLGRIYAADFVNNNPRGFPVRLQRLFSNGDIDPSFAAPPLSGTSAITVLSDGRIAVGFNGGMMVLKPDGSQDAFFNIPEGTIGTTISGIIEDRGGLIITGGDTLIRLLNNGQIDPSFPPAAGGKINDAIRLSDESLLFASGNATFNGGNVPPVFSVFARSATLDFSPAGIIVSENTTSFEVTIRATGNLTSPINATITSVDNSALAGTHFTAVSESLTFDAANMERVITVTLSDDASSNDTREFSLLLESPDLTYSPEFSVQILDDESAPIITTQPQSLLVLPGETASVSVVLQDDSGATIQWFRNGQTVNNGTNFTYQPIIGGSYHAEITRNGVTVRSDSALVTFQQDGSAIRSGFGFSSPLIQNPVKVIKTGPEGAAYVGAQSQFNGVGALWRILPDNSPDPVWSPMIVGTVHDFAVEPDGAAVVVGDLDIRDDSPVISQIARYQNDGTRDLDFQTNIGTGANTNIRIISRYENGDLLVGGDFSQWNGTALSPNSSLVKLDASGNRIPGFNCDRFGNPVSAVALPDGGALVIYSSTVYRLDSSGATTGQKFLNNGLKQISPAGNDKWLVVSSQNFSFGGNSGTVVRLDADLNIEQVFPIAKAETAHAQANGKVIVGGSFISGGHRKIIRFLADGTIDSTFSNANGLRTFSEIDGNLITSLAGRPDGSIWVGGTFPGYGPANQVNFPNLALINGDPVILSITTQPLDQFVATGQPVTLTAAASSDLALSYQWSLNGTPLTDNGSVSGSQTAELTLTSPVVSGDYQLTVTGGPATVLSNVAFVGVLDSPVIRRITGDLTTASDLPVLLQVEAFGAGTLTYQWLKNGSPLAGQTSPLLNIPVSKVGDSGSYSVTITNALGSLTSNPIEVEVLQNGASVFEGFTGPSVGGNINDLLVLPDDKVLVAGDFFSFRSGDFTVVGGRYLAAMQSDGTVIPDHGLNINNRVQALALQPDGKIIIAGSFSEVGGMPRKQVARLNADLTLDESFDPGDVLPGFATIYQVAVDPDGKILVVHSDRNANYLVRLLADGTNDPSFVVAPSSLVRNIVPQSNGTYLVGGYFSNWDQTGTFDDSALVKIANDGALIAIPNFMTSSNRVDSLYPLSNGDLFTTYQNLSLEILGANGLPVTDRFTGFTPNSSITKVVEAPNGQIYLGGLYTEINGAPAGRLARTSSDGTLDPAFDVGTGFNNTVQALALNDNGSIWVAGRFTEYNGNPASYITLLNGTYEPPATRSFDDFIAATNLDPADQGFNLDPDQDGFSNGLEFLLGGNPELAEPNLIPEPRFQPGTALGMASDIPYLTMEVSIAEDLVDLPWSVQASTHLDFTNGQPAIQVGESTTADGFTTYLFRMPWSGQDFDGKGFLRLSFTKP